MGEPSKFLAEKRYAVVTGSNKGIGLEICKQLASQGVVVVLTSRDENRGLEALENLKNNNSGLCSENLHYHQLDVTDNSTIASLADFILSKFGKLDILVNNAGVNGVEVDFDAMKAPGRTVNYFEMIKQTYELAEECLKTNYYGAKKISEAFLPLLKLSDSPRIINISSRAGKLKNIQNERFKEILSDAENSTEEKIDEILTEFLRDFKENSLKEKGWPSSMSAYIVSKAALSAYTRMMAKKHSSIIINCVCPGVVKTDMNGHMGNLTAEQGAESAVRLALLPHGSPSGLFFEGHQVSSF